MKTARSGESLMPSSMCRHAFSLKRNVAGLRRDRPLVSFRRDDHAIARLVVDADEIVHVTVQRRGLSFQPRDVPHLHARVVEDFRGADARIRRRQRSDLDQRGENDDQAQHGGSPFGTAAL